MPPALIAFAPGNTLALRAASAKVQWWGAGRPVFFDPRGGTHFDGGWEPPRIPADPVAALIDLNGARGARPDGWTASARWERESYIPDAVRLRFDEAVDGW